MNIKLFEEFRDNHYYEVCELEGNNEFEDLIKHHLKDGRKMTRSQKGKLSNFFLKYKDDGKGQLHQFSHNPSVNYCRDCILIFVHSKNINYTIHIYTLPEEWFYVKLKSSDRSDGHYGNHISLKYYKCDQFDGLISFLSENIK